MRKGESLTSIQSVGQSLHEICEARNHLHPLADIPHHTIAPLEDIPQLLLNLRGRDVVGIEVVPFSLLMDLLGLSQLIVFLLASDGKLGQDVLQAAGVGLVLLRGLSMCECELRSKSFSALTFSSFAVRSVTLAWDSLLQVQSQTPVTSNHQLVRLLSSFTHELQGQSVSV